MDLISKRSFRRSLFLTSNNPRVFTRETLEIRKDSAAYVSLSSVPQFQTAGPKPTPKQARSQKKGRQKPLFRKAGSDRGRFEA